MTGYTRQSSADIVPTAVVRATPLNNEFNLIRDAFALATGHRHDGTAAEGHVVPFISDDNGYNKVATDSTNNRVGVFVNVSSAAVEQVRFQNNLIVPVTNNVLDIGSSSFKVKDFYLAGTATLATLAATTATISGGTINSTVIGNSTAAAITGTTVTASSLIATTAAISAGTINGAVIGGSSAQAITGTTITANTGFVGGLTGAVTGNTAGTHTGAVVGNVTGNLTGNVTASTGTSSFNDVTINGGLNMDASSAATITNLTSPTNSGDAATKGYVDTSISALVNGAPGALDTLNELSTALGADANFATTVTNSIATKLALAGGTMSGAIAMGTSKITGLGDPTANQDAATKNYVDTADALKLSLTGGTMSGAIAMGSSKITGLGTPTANQDATTKLYVDGILGSATSAAASAAAAATSASNAATSESNASTSATNAASSATSAAASYDSFDDRYLGPKASNPTVDNDGNTLLTGALYFNTTSSEMRVWSGTAWLAAYNPGGVTSVGGTGTVNGITLTGTVTSTGNLTLGGTLSGVSLTTQVTGTLPMANGGTNTTATPTAGTVAYGTGTAIAYTTAGTTGQALLSNGSSAPTWGTAGVSAGKAIAFAMVMGF